MNEDHRPPQAPPHGGHAALVTRARSNRRDAAAAAAASLRYRTFVVVLGRADGRAGAHNLLQPACALRLCAVRALITIFRLFVPCSRCFERESFRTVSALADGRRDGQGSLPLASCQRQLSTNNHLER